MGTEINRFHLLTRDDLHNINRSFNLYNGRNHKDDATSVKILVDSFSGLENNPIHFYQTEQEGREFMMVIMTSFQKNMLLKFGEKSILIDGTHGTNEYGFLLFTLLVVDELNEGIPVSFCFSKKESTDILVTFFRVIAEAIGKSISTNIFMSDGAEAFYNAWVKVNPKPQRKLLCSWHVHKNWVSNAASITDGTKRKLILKTLRAIAEEVDEEKYRREMNNFLTQLKNDESTLRFHDYLKSYYLSKENEWALCFRKYTHITTNMHLEAFHRSLKVDYMHGKKCNRLDETIAILFAFVRDKKFQRLITATKDKSTKRIKHIRDSHARKDSVKIRQVDDVWIANEKYLIKRSKPENICCKLLCNMCEICIHAYVCSCPNNMVQYNICKHIHQVAYTLKSSSPSTSQDETTQFQHDAIEEFRTDNGKKDDSIETFRREIIAKTEMILGYANSDLQTEVIDAAKAQQIQHWQNKIITIYGGETGALPSIKKGAKRRKFEKQSYFPKKKKKEVARMPPISTTEKEIIQNSTLNGEDETLNCHSGFDHQYY